VALDRGVELWLAESGAPIEQDYEVLPASSEAFIRLAVLSIMLQRLARQR
jgi:hypothetical protein